jgi:hypothetical protein
MSFVWAIKPNNKRSFMREMADMFGKIPCLCHAILNCRSRKWIDLVGIGFLLRFDSFERVKDYVCVVCGIETSLLSRVGLILGLIDVEVKRRNYQMVVAVAVVWVTFMEINLRGRKRSGLKFTD